MSDKFRLFETDKFSQSLEQDFRGQSVKIKAKLTNLVYPQIKQNPYFGKHIKKLKNYEPQTWRYRIGDFRFFYTIDDKRKFILMISADNRSDSY